jgi:hypothetical protein
MLFLAPHDFNYFCTPDFNYQYEFLELPTQYSKFGDVHVVLGMFKKCFRTTLQSDL